MKKRIQLIVVTLALAALIITPAFAAAERSLTLLSIYYIPHKGVVFTLSPQGTFKASELEGYASVGGGKYSLDCRFSDDGLVKCTGEQGLSRYVGQMASGVVAGFPFYGLIRSNSYCYSLWIYNNGAWLQASTICGARKPAMGDWILVSGDALAFFNPNGPNGAGFYLEAGGPAN